MKPHLIAVAIAALFFATPAKADTDICTEITALPFTITVQGVYCLKKNLNVNLTTGNAITVNAGNVVVDFNDFRVNNQAASTNTANSVFAQDRKHVTLRNGFVRGFRKGIFLAENSADASASHLVEGMKIADSGEIGIEIAGDFSVVRNNRVFGTIGSANNIRGILISTADFAELAGNIISSVVGANANGIHVQSSNGVKVIDNSITEITSTNGATGPARGITVDTSDDTLVARNRILRGTGIGNNESGIFGFGSAVNLACVDNDIGAFNLAVSGCDFVDNNRTLF